MVRIMFFNVVDKSAFELTRSPSVSALIKLVRGYNKEVRAMVFNDNWPEPAFWIEECSVEIDLRAAALDYSF